MLESCSVVQAGSFVRALVGGGTDTEIQDCYRDIAHLCIREQVRKALVIGAAGDPSAHHALVSGLRCAALAGLPKDFRLALVAEAAGLEDVFAQAEQEAAGVGLHTRLFSSETEAIGWLTAS